MLPSQQPKSHIKPFLYIPCIWATTCGFQHCGTFTSADPDEPAQPPPSLGNSNAWFGLDTDVWSQVYNSFLIYCRELAQGTVSLTGDRAQGDDSKHDLHYSVDICDDMFMFCREF